MNILTEREKLIERTQVQMDITFSSYYMAFLILLFVVCSIVSYFSPPKEDIPDDPVKQTTHKEIVGPKYTIRVGLGGSRKIIPTLTGKTVEERTKEFLDLHGKGDTFEIWKKASNDFHIDYTLPVCIAWADSHLGMALKSKNNIGNVGNNDRGDTVEYKDIASGINAIYGALNGRWLSKHLKVGELSGEGRIRMKLPLCGNGNFCYATSTEYWSTNVTNCLKILQDKKVEEDFEFRRK